MTLAFAGGQDRIKDTLLPNGCLRTPEIVFYKNTGHWVQQERHREVSEALIKFVTKHTSDSNKNSKGDANSILSGYLPKFSMSRL